MFLDLRHMRGTRDRVDRTYPPSAFDPQEDAFRVVGPVRLAFDLHKDRAQFRLVGHLSSVLAMPCGRCLDDFRRPVDIGFDLLYLPSTANTGEGEVEVEDEDLGTAFYRDETIDLGGLVREQLYLALPMKPLCAESCRGLCPQCGVNLNTTSCGCTPLWDDPRLAALKALGGQRDPETTH
jgi:uncharacterized protein